MTRSVLSTASAAAVLVPLLAAGSTLAQEDAPAGLFTEARQLPLVEQSVRVDVAGAEARVKLVQVFANDGDDVAQADLRLDLPREAVVTGFGFWQGDRFLESALKEKGEAEASHHKAASDGRATGLLKKKADNLSSFSVYPVEAGERKRVEVELRLPVETEAGQSHVRLPIDRFLGEAAISTAVVVTARTTAPLVDIGADGASAVRVVQRRERSAVVMLTTTRSATVWWQEQAPPLLVRVERAALEGDAQGTGITIALNDGAPWGATRQDVKLLVDASFSMRRQRGALADVVQRTAARVGERLRVYGIAESARELPAPSTGDARATVDAALDGRLGFSASWQRMARWLKDQRCDAAEVRCAVVTDAQLEGVEQAAKGEHPVLFFATPDELAYAGDALGEHARVYQPRVDPTAKLQALADELVLPALRVVSVEDDGAPIKTIGRSRALVVEGGLLRLYTEAPVSGPVTVAMTLAGHDVERTVPVTALPAGSPEAGALRRAIYQRTLRAWMKRYRESGDYALKDRIVALSVRENIPTSLTALHVEDPSLSLYAIKPGDPLLSVPARPCVEEVIAFYPFGESRALTLDARNDRFLDRFLVPRGWGERAYRVDVFERCDDGSVTRRDAWYRLDERGPGARVFVDGRRGELVIETRATGDVGGVTIEGADGSLRRLSPVGDVWRVPLAELPARFAVQVRDRAGNRTRFDCVVEGERLRVLEEKKPAGPHLRTASASPLPVVADAGRGARVRGLRTFVDTPAGEVSFSRADLDLRSLDVTSLTSVGPGRWLVGTRAGDLASLRCGDDARCAAEAVTTRFAEHPITGLVHLGRGRTLVGVLGQGLFELRGERLRRSRWKVGSRFVTALQAGEGEVLVGTAYNGLWRITSGRAIKTGFPHDHVAGLAATSAGVEVLSGFGRFVRRERDRFVRVGAPAAAAHGARRFVAAARVGREVVLGSFGDGLYRLDDGRLTPLDVRGLAGEARHINALEVVAGRLWAATEGGVFVVDVATGQAQRKLDDAAYDLAGHDGHVAVATKRGLWVADEGGALARVDGQGGGSTARFGAVAFHGDALYAGGLDGLARFDGWRSTLRSGARAVANPLAAGAGFDAGWVTALLSDGERLLVGTYDEGVWQVLPDGAGHDAASRVPGLERWWVPFGALQRVDGAIFVGGLGMPAARLSGADVTTLSLPAADTFAALSAGGELLLLTNEGVLRAPPRRLATLLAR
jgi:hypothetical protein